jgi:hypothetical protein
MKLEITTRQRKEKVQRAKLRKRESCPKCGSKGLLEEGVDQFCCDCTWDTCFEYVEMGLMDNLEVAAWEHFAGLAQKQTPTINSKEANESKEELVASA